MIFGSINSRLATSSCGEMGRNHLPLYIALTDRYFKLWSSGVHTSKDAETKGGWNQMKFLKTESERKQKIKVNELIMFNSFKKYERKGWVQYKNSFWEKTDCTLQGLLNLLTEESSKSKSYSWTYLLIHRAKIGSNLWQSLKEYVRYHTTEILFITMDKWVGIQNLIGKSVCG